MASVLSNQNYNSDDESTNNNQLPSCLPPRLAQYNINGAASTTTWMDPKHAVVSDSDDTHSRSSLQPRENSSSSQRDACPNGFKCPFPRCSSSHPLGWHACEDGKDCDDFDCQANHPYGRRKPCRDSFRCRKKHICHFLHPVMHANACPFKEQCYNYNCDK